MSLGLTSRAHDVHVGRQLVTVPRVRKPRRRFLDLSWLYASSLFHSSWTSLYVCCCPTHRVGLRSSVKHLGKALHRHSQRCASFLAYQLTIELSHHIPIPREIKVVYAFIVYPFKTVFYNQENNTKI